MTHDNATYDVKARELQLTDGRHDRVPQPGHRGQDRRAPRDDGAAGRGSSAFADESYQVGAKTFLDVTTARGQYEQAAVGRVNAIYDYHKAFAALEQAVGRPLR